MSLEVSSTPIIFPSSSATGVAWINQTLSSFAATSTDLLFPVMKTCSSGKHSENGPLIKEVVLRLRPTACFRFISRYSRAALFAQIILNSGFMKTTSSFKESKRAFFSLSCSFNSCSARAISFSIPLISFESL